MTAGQDRTTPHKEDVGASCWCLSTAKRLAACLNLLFSYVLSVATIVLSPTRLSRQLFCSDALLSAHSIASISASTLLSRE